MKKAQLPWLRLLLHIPIHVQLPFGSRWIAENDSCGRAILRGDFEIAETRFVEQYLQPGMTVLDIGAHHGYYSLLASASVGKSGKVVAFEPSVRERGKLRHHLELNHCENVTVEEFAVGANDGRAEFFVVQGIETGCNSLRPPIGAERTKKSDVAIKCLDAYTAEHGLSEIDFIKMDVEGGELEVLRGAERLLERKPRPVILCEVQDERTRAWSYAAIEIIEKLQKLDFRWFRLPLEGSLRPLAGGKKTFDGNFVAVPEERLEQLQLSKVLAQ